MRDERLEESARRLMDRVEWGVLLGLLVLTWLMAAVVVVVGLRGDHALARNGLLVPGGIWGGSLGVLYGRRRWRRR